MASPVFLDLMLSPMPPEVKSLLAGCQNDPVLKEMHGVFNRADPMANTQPKRLEALKEPNDYPL